MPVPTDYNQVCPFRFGGEDQFIRNRRFPESSHFRARIHIVAGQKRNDISESRGI